MTKTAVVFASGITHNTKTVAEYISGNIDSDLFDLKAVDPDISSYDNVVIGTGIHAGKIYKQVEAFVRKNKDVLAKKNVSLFLMCLYNDSKGDRQLKAISDKLGIEDSRYFNMRDAPKGGVPPAVDDFIKGLV